MQYVDDTLTFGKENVLQAMILKWVFLCYEKWSRLKIYSHKSSLIFLGDI